MFQKRPQGRDSRENELIWGSGMLYRGHGPCKGPEEGACFNQSNIGKEGSVHCRGVRKMEGDEIM